jgi:D-alanyl-D-alanine carboxypeptidase/D-alanyl-D-alanine-endopeptidase (penicillin-binding protein 4)
MDSESDNFYAEMLTKLLGAEETGKGTTAAGTAVIRRELSERGVPLAGVRLLDGSGLSTGDRLTAIALASILTKLARDPELAGVFRRSLAVAGVSGTLEDRMERPPARGRVRAKTGTTAESSALAGYAGPRYVFALIMNGSPVSAFQARAAQDRFATVLAGAQ